MADRLPDWRKRLDTVVRDYNGQPFAWGSRDCAHWSADCVRAVTGVDVLGRHRGAWNSLLSCKAHLLALGYRSNRAAAAGMLAPIGAREIPLTEAQYGDVGITAAGALAVRLQPGFIVRDSQGRFGVEKVVAIWSIGH